MNNRIIADSHAEGGAEAAMLLVSTSSSGATPMLLRLLDLQLPLAVTLGQTTLPIHEILQLTSGSVVELDRQAGEYLDLSIHGTVVARGEIVSVKGNYGVRIKEIISPQERMALPAAA